MNEEKKPKDGVDGVIATPEVRRVPGPRAILLAGGHAANPETEKPRDPMDYGTAQHTSAFAPKTDKKPKEST